ncbi:DUF4270 domain-containing protein [Epilithonimonas mollis]|uniref:DUF4270 domain-containing protein n=1 Tax=Epilithonimonas mollis TaxID=216903 RepID=A0A1M6S2P9_9FLAO|nr:DUF4270 domain-containing protein [Epilithonimonas mollis]SHK39023.1 protein of unknown function [Epilithonimonas mollis]
MTKIKSLIKLFPLLLMGIIVLNSCEGELDNLGSQLVNESEAYDKVYALLGYNINNNDTIRADASKLDSVRIGAFKEPVFGGQKASYITQVRLNAYNPDFGKNPVLDSVVLTLKPKYQTAADSATTTTNEDYIYPDGQVAAKKVVITYPVAKYGRAKIGTEKTKFTLEVHEVNDFLGGTSDKLYSNKTIALGSKIGSKVFDGTVNSVTITKDSDASEILKRDPSFRMKLDSAFFQNKIIAKQGNQVLKDAASFIRYFRGISISVLEDEGYLFSMAPNDAAITIYYKNDVTAADGTVTKTKQETTLNLGGSNVHLSKITYDRSSTYLNTISPAGSPNDTTGDELLYAQGMGGASFGVKIPVSTIIKLRNQYKNDKIGIVSAKIRLYNDNSNWDNKYKKPTSMLVKEKDTVKRFLPDMTLLASAGYSLVKTANLSTKDAYYEIGITASLKKIIEDDASYDIIKNNGKDFIIDLGSYLANQSTGILLGQTYNDRAYNPFRLALTGTDKSKIGDEISTNSKNVQLRIIYTKK